MVCLRLYGELALERKPLCWHGTIRVQGPGLGGQGKISEHSLGNARFQLLPERGTCTQDVRARYRFVLLHYWDTGSTIELARGLKSAQETQNDRRRLR